MTDTLTNQQRQFIVERLAAFDSTAEVAQALAEQFGVTVAPCVIAGYDPTRRAGQHCRAYWKNQFHAAREAFMETPPPVASRMVRLNTRNKMLAEAMRREDFLTANRILDSIAKEIGDDTTGLYTRVEPTDEDRARALAVFIRKMEWKARELRPRDEEAARAWDRDPVAQFMAMLGPPPKKARGRRTQPVKQSE